MRSMLPSNRDCQEGWYDSSSVGLGCILPDLTDHAEEGTWVWPSGMAANFTWNEDYGEPYPDTEDYEYDCAQMLSSEWDALKWMSYSCDDTGSTYPVCQLP